jgi:hypothetical protein
MFMNESESEIEIHSFLCNVCSIPKEIIKWVGYEPLHHVFKS